MGTEPEPRCTSCCRTSQGCRAHPSFGVEQLPRAGFARRHVRRVLRTAVGKMPVTILQATTAPVMGALIEWISHH